MLIITKKIKDILKNKKLSQYRLAKLIGYDHGGLGSMIRGEKPFPEDKIEKIAPILEVPPEIIKSWILADKYPKDLLKQAIAVKQQATAQQKTLIFTEKIDEILQNKGLSRTGLSKIIGYSQGSLNEMIIGKKPMSKQIISRIAPVLEVSEDEIRSWIVADKYSFEVLRVALECK